MNNFRRLLVCVPLVLAALPAYTQEPSPELKAAVSSPRRSAVFVQRDPARHPAEELAFLGIDPHMSVIEVFPGGGYWTEILAPYLKDQGTLTVALPTLKDPEANDPARNPYRKKLAANPNDFGKVRFAELGKDHTDIAPKNSVDMILTFRNLHNWMNAGYAEAALAGFYRALKPGGILGIEDHRARADRPQDPKSENGYVRQDYAIELARKAGFEWVAASEINANPRDTTDWPEGVWTLPPTLALKDKDREKYLAIGEADNFVLKFRKPAHE
jgi:predicted methyltransferase